MLFLRATQHQLDIYPWLVLELPHLAYSPSFLWSQSPHFCYYSVLCCSLEKTFVSCLLPLNASLLSSLHTLPSPRLAYRFLKGIKTDIGMQGQPVAGRECNNLYFSSSALRSLHLSTPQHNSTAPESRRTKTHGSDKQPSQATRMLLNVTSRWEPSSLVLRSI